jgi:hypothetical protein
MKYFTLCLALTLLAGCGEPFGEPVIVQNPQTGETVLCKTEASEWNPWSQGDACVAGHLAEGWMIARSARD